jgi:hypothetical protein
VEKTLGQKLWLSAQMLVGFALALCIDEFSTNGMAYGQNDPNKTNLRVEGISMARTPTGITEVTGNIVNNSTSSVDDIEVDVAFFDKGGNQLGKFSNFVTQPSFVLKPGQSHSFNTLETISFYSIGGTNVTATADLLK